MNQRLKIAFVVHDYNHYGGHSRYVVELARRFRHEHEIHIFTNTVETEDRQGLHFHHIPAIRRNALTTILSFILPATFRVRGHFDIIHAQGLCGLRQDVVTAHMCIAALYSGIEKTQGRLRRKQQFFRLFTESLERMTYRRRLSPVVIAISDRVRLDLALFYHRSYNVHVIHHGVNLEIFHPDRRSPGRSTLRRDLGLPDPPLLALYAGDMQKGAIPAIQSLKDAHGVHLVLVSGSVRAPYEELARREGVSDRVHFHPFSKQVEKYFAAADVFVFPTWYDPFGMVISEAMASGLPVITSLAAGAAEWIQHGSNGWLTSQPWSVAEISEALCLMRDQPELRQRMEFNARQVAEANTWDSVAAQTMKLYQDHVAGKNRRMTDQ